MPLSKTLNGTPPSTYAALYRKVKATLLDGQRRIEAERVRTYWETGKIIQEHILQNDRADYGAEVFNRLSTDLQIDKSTLQRCVRFFKCYPRFKIEGRGPQFSWTQYRKLITVTDGKQRAAFEALTERNDLSAAELAVRIRAARNVVTPDEAKGRVEEPQTRAAALAPSVPKLAPLRGSLYTYQIIKPKLVTNDAELVIDLGFSMFRSVDKRLVSSFSAGDIVESVRKDDAYKFMKSGRTPKDLYTYEAWVERIVDGDTLKVAIDLGFESGLRTTLRLRGIDCPELGAKAGDEAKAFVQSLIKEADRVIIRSSRDDKYGRYLADVYLTSSPPESDDHNSPSGGGEVYLNGLLIEKGMAERME